MTTLLDSPPARRHLRIAALIVSAMILLALVGPIPAGAATSFSNCRALSRVQKYGVAVSQAAANLQGQSGHFRPFVSEPLYNANSNLDVDMDGTACEVLKPVPRPHSQLIGPCGSQYNPWYRASFDNTKSVNSVVRYRFTYYSATTHALTKIVRRVWAGHRWSTPYVHVLGNTPGQVHGSSLLVIWVKYTHPGDGKVTLVERARSAAPSGGDWPACGT
jgi:hypothetical protein